MLCDRDFLIVLQEHQLRRPPRRQFLHGPRLRRRAWRFRYDAHAGDLPLQAKDFANGDAVLGGEEHDVVRAAAKDVEGELDEGSAAEHSAGADVDVDEAPLDAGADALEVPAPQFDATSDGGDLARGEERPGLQGIRWASGKQSGTKRTLHG